MAKSPKKKGPTVPADESKADKFRRLAKQRVPKAVRIISNIGNLASKGGYEFTSEQADKIDGALIDAVKGVRARFTKALGGADDGAADSGFDI